MPNVKLLVRSTHCLTEGAAQLELSGRPRAARGGGELDAVEREQQREEHSVAHQEDPEAEHLGLGFAGLEHLEAIEPEPDMAELRSGHAVNSARP